MHPGFEGLKIISAGKDGVRERVPASGSHGDNVLANEVVRHFSNLIAKECWKSAKRVLRAKHALGELLILTFQTTRRDNIYKIGKPRKHFFDEQASQGSR